MTRHLAPILLLALLAHPAAAAVAPMDFAYGRTLVVPQGTAIGEFELPEEIYGRVVERDLGDIAVFNGGGELVPFRLLLPPPQKEQAPPPRELKFFPLPAPAAPPEEALKVTLLTDREGGSVSVRSDSRPAPPEPVYIVDLGEIEGMLQSLLFEWSASEDVMARVSIARGTDMEHWSPFTGPEVLYRLQYGGHLIERSTLDLPPRQNDLLRITFAGVPPDFRLLGVRGVVSPGNSGREHRQLSIPGEPQKPHEYLFTLPGPLAVEQVRVIPPQPNTLARGTLHSRPAPASPWVVRGSVQIYAFDLDGLHLTAPPLKVFSGHDREWLLRVDGRGGGLGAGIPRLEIDMVPHRLRFIARGEPPFLLAYGSGRGDRHGQQVDDGLLRLPGPDGQATLARKATVGPEHLLGGRDALRGRLTPERWKTITLWSALVVSVLLLAAMAFALSRRHLAPTEGEERPEDR